MNHNPHNFKTGDTAILDAGFHNSSRVIIVSITPQGMFSAIRLADEHSGQWEVMTYRLTPIKEEK